MALEPTRIPATSLIAPTKTFAAPAISTVRPVADFSAMPAFLRLPWCRPVFLPLRSGANIAGQRIVRPPQRLTAAVREAVQEQRGPRERGSHGAQGLADTGSRGGG